MKNVMCVSAQVVTPNIIDSSRREMTRNVIALSQSGRGGSTSR
jgi:hypothetical protein